MFTCRPTLTALNRLTALADHSHAKRAAELKICLFAIAPVANLFSLQYSLYCGTPCSMQRTAASIDRSATHQLHDICHAKSAAELKIVISSKDCMFTCKYTPCKSMHLQCGRISPLLGVFTLLPSSGNVGKQSQNWFIAELSCMCLLTIQPKYIFSLVHLLVVFF